ncbi:pyocin activator PrtN family protein [Aurantimonas sp. 22II-16-19i]|uniref:pyocin activator PrtN family protein n=1 Tax=Aurantimonas sp. 22II-16-19i TaxID=1317114 RepID=UPI0009F7E09A|nr:pyocin activator PrtN family protein [Aurantimonas sp. 22II-16-19i]ORE90615.1 hypothetical protein ATO4_21150 [Aurantimonas sp. 22II-16-19i]
MKTVFILLAQYDGRAIIPLETVRDDYFWHLTLDKFARKLSRGEIAIPLVRLETSQKAARGVHVADLAAWIDQRRAAGIKELQQLTGTAWP